MWLLVAWRSEGRDGILEGDGEAEPRSYMDFVLGVKPTRLTDGVRWRL